MTQDAIENYQKKNPQLVSKINFTKAPAPELPGKLKAMQGAGRSDIDMVLTGTDFLAAGIARRDRFGDRRVVADRLQRELVRMKMMLKPTPQLRALIP